MYNEIIIKDPTTPQSVAALFCCQETTNYLKQVSCLTLTFRSVLLQVTMLWLIFVTVNIRIIVLLWFDCRHGDVCTAAPLVNVNVTPIHTSVRH